MNWRRLIVGTAGRVDALTRARSVAARDDVQGIAEGPEELAPRTGDEQLVELGQGDAVGLGVDERGRDEVAEDVGAAHPDVGEAGVGEERLELLDVEAARQRVGAPPSTGRVDEGRPGLAELAGDGLGEDDGQATGDEQRQDAAVAQRLRDGVERRRGVVDELERAVAAGEVDAAPGEDGVEGVAVTLDRR